MSGRPTVFGASYSVYVKAVRLSLWAKHVPYDLVEVDVFAPAGPPAAYLSRQPFGRIPAFEHGDCRLYETAPICRYIDEAFAGPPLQPSTPSSRAVMGQAVSIMDSYAYRSLVWGIYVERIDRPQRGVASDLVKIEAARELANTCLGALENLAPAGDWLAGDVLSLADLHAAPMFALFMKTTDARELMESHERLTAWWRRIEEHVAPAQVLG
ncbi:MAG: glutathione S-transferase family protein [Kofleriaceae bacterium]